MLESRRCGCRKLHLQGPAHLHEEGMYRSFVKFREHYTLPWAVFQKWEGKWPTELRLIDESLADLRREN
jgi:hypothetical protein